MNVRSMLATIVVSSLAFAACSSGSFSASRGPAPGGGPGVLQVSPGQVSVQMHWAGRTTASVALRLDTSNAGTVGWTVTSTEPWLSVSPTSGVTPSSVQIALDPVSLPPGTVQATLTCTSSAAPAVTVGVVLDLVAPVWSPAGAPQGGSVVSFAYMAPATMFAAAGNGGLWASQDQGLHWAPTWLYGQSQVQSVAVCNVGGAGVVLAATYDQGVSRSVDQGQSWTWSVTGMGSRRQIFSVVCNPSNGKAYALANQGPVYESDDGGQSWTSLGAPPSVAVYSMTTEGTSAIVVGTSAGIDSWNGSWQPASGPMSGSAVVSMASDPYNAAHLAAGTRGGGLFSSSDGGQTWSGPATGSAGQVVWGISFDPTWQGRAYAALEGGLLSSADGGATWSPASATGPMLSAFAAPRGVQFAGGRGQGILRSTDAGSTWQPAPGLAAANVTRILYPAASTAWAATYGSGLFRSTDGATTWTAVPSPGSDLLTAWIDPTEGSHLIVSVDHAGLFASYDGGASWMALTGINAQSVEALASDPTDPSRLYAASYDASVWRSDDGGMTWTPVPVSVPGPPVLTVYVAANGDVGAGTYGSGMYVSRDQGATWSAMGSFSTVTSILATGGLVLVGTQGSGLEASANGGFSFTNVAAPGGSVYCLTSTSDGLLAGTSAGLLASTDQGNTWQMLQKGLPPFRLQDVVEDPAALGRLVGATNGGSVYLYR